MRLRLRQIQIVRRFQDKPVMVEAEDFGLYAVHRSAFGRDGWTVTHIPSQLAFGFFTTAGAARLCAWAAQGVCASSFWVNAGFVPTSSIEGIFANSLVELWKRVDSRLMARHGDGAVYRQNGT